MLYNAVLFLFAQPISLPPSFKDEAGGVGKLPYKAGTVHAMGLPPSCPELRKVNLYGRDQLKAIMENSQQIYFQISRWFQSE